MFLIILAAPHLPIFKLPIETQNMVQYQSFSVRIIGSIDEMSALDHMGLTFLRTLMWRMKELGQIQVRFVASMDFVPGIEPQEGKTGRGKGA